LGKTFSREEILARIAETMNQGKPVIGAGCSAGIIAKSAELGGADLIIVYSTGKSRLMGLPTSYIGHSNPITLEMFEEIQNVVKETPVIAGIEAADPTTWDLERLLKRFIGHGYDGIINFPTMGIYGKERRELRESVGTGFSREIQMVQIAHRMDIFTIVYAFNPEDAKALTEAGADVVCAHAGGTAGGLIGFRSAPLEIAVDRVQRIIEAVREIRPDVICLAHGGPFSEPQNTTYLYEHTDAQGFVGASSIERIPVEKAVIECVKSFKSITLKRGKR